MLGRRAVLCALAYGFLACRRRAASSGGPAARIVSLSPSTTEALFAVGAGGQMVGRSRFCDWPPEAAGIPQVGGYVDPNFEAILALRPDLVTGARGPAGPAISEKLAAQGIETYFPDTETFAGIDAMLLGLGDRTGHAADARRVVDALHAREETIATAVAGSPARRALLLFDIEPPVAAGPESFADEMLRRAGGSNAVKAGAYPTLALEHVMALDPEVIVYANIAAAHGKALTPETPGWNAVRAVREGHVIRLDDERVLRPGPRVAEGLALIARALHPDAVIP